MIRRVQIRNYRALRHIDVWLDRFHLLVGPNASGKSTFLDVLAFVRDLLLADLPSAVFGQPKLGITARCADPRELTWKKQGGSIEIAIEIDLPDPGKPPNGHSAARYELEVKIDPELGIRIETLFLMKERRERPIRPPENQDLFALRKSTSILHPARKQPPEGWKKVVEKTEKTDRYTSETKRWVTPFKLGPLHSTLGSLPKDEWNFPAALFVKQLLAERVFSLALNASAMRRPSPAGLSHDLSPDVSNLPWVVERLSSEDPKRFAAWRDHIRTALPEIENIRTAERPEDRSRYIVVNYRGGLETPAWLVSDGTLRLLALTLLAYIELPASIVLIEEPENGLHPQALETVLQSLQSVQNAQLLAASHSPIVLDLVDPKELLCFVKDKDGAVDILRGDEDPKLRDLIEQREAIDLSLLFASGVLG